MTKEMPNFAPFCFQVNPIVWSNGETSMIEKIKKRLAFDADFDLHGHLSQLSVDAASLLELERQTPSPKEVRDFLSTLKKEITKAKKHAENIAASLEKINKLQALFEGAGTKITNLIADKNQDNYVKIVALRNVLDFFNENNIPGLYMNLAAMKNLSGKFSKMIDNAETSLPKIKKGAPSKPFVKGLIQFLQKIYNKGTQQTATCGWDDLKKRYVGNFYEFLIAITPHLEKKLKISMGTASTLGKYAREILTETNK